MILAYSVKRELLESPFFVKYFGTITYGLRIKSKYQLAYPLLSFAMRFTLAILLVRDNFVEQLLVYPIVFLLYFCYVASCKPSISRRDHAVEMVHLSFLMSHNVLRFVYTEYVLDESVRYDVGWVSICLLVAQLLLCIFLIIGPALINLRLGAKKLYNNFYVKKRNMKDRKQMY